jgi:hypothetical protein
METNMKSVQNNPVVAGFRSGKILLSRIVSDRAGNTFISASFQSGPAF